MPKCMTSSSSAAARPGSVLANRLSAKSANKILLCEAGQDTPPGNEPAGDARQLSGHGLFRSALSLDRTQGHDPGRQPQQSRAKAARRLRKYEQARVLGGGSSINGQLANRGAPTDYDEWDARGAAAGAGRTCCPISRRSSATWISTAHCTARRAASRSAASPPEHWTGHSQAVGRGLQAGRL